LNFRSRPYLPVAAFETGHYYFRNDVPKKCGLNTQRQLRSHLPRLINIGAAGYLSTAKRAFAGKEELSKIFKVNKMRIAKNLYQHDQQALI
jgi:hypothetical protein